MEEPRFKLRDMGLEASLRRWRHHRVRKWFKVILIRLSLRLMRATGVWWEDFARLSHAGRIVVEGMWNRPMPIVSDEEVATAELILRSLYRCRRSDIVEYWEQMAEGHARQMKEMGLEPPPPND